MTIMNGNGTGISASAIRDLCATKMAPWGVTGKRVLAIVPDGTRTAPMGLLFRVLHDLLAHRASRFDVLIATGTHPPMSEEAINERFELTAHDRSHAYSGTRFINHRWDDATQLVSIGTITADEVEAISG